MQSIFGVDFDGTICNTSQLKQEYLKDCIGLDIKTWEANRTTLTQEKNLLSEQGYNKMVEAICNREKTLSAEPMPGAYEALRELSGEGRTYLITNRGGLSLSTAVEWMCKTGMDEFIDGYISSRVFNQRKLEICESRSIDFLIDDDPGNLSELNGNVTGVLLRLGYDGDFPENGIKYAKDWGEALQYII